MYSKSCIELFVTVSSRKRVCKSSTLVFIVTMGHLRNVRIGLVLCVLTSSSFFVFKMYNKFDAIKPSYPSSSSSMKIQQIQRGMDTKISTAKQNQTKASSNQLIKELPSITEKVPKTPKATPRATGPESAPKRLLPGPGPEIRPEGVPANASLPNKVRLSNNDNITMEAQSVHDTRAHPSTRDGNKNTTAAGGNPKDSVAGGDLAYEQKFVNEVEHFLQKLPSNNSYGDIIMEVINRAKSRIPAWKQDETESLHDSQFLNYMKCPSSVRTKLLANPFTRRKFIPETPMLAWKDHYTPEEYSRLAKYHGIYGWQDYNETDVSSALAGLNSFGNSYMFDGQRGNDKLSNGSRCIRCAVIGNGGILNGSKMGKEIDANDYVFRVNTALTKGYEDDVGRRTSFYCFGMFTLSNTLALGRRTTFTMPPNDEGVRYVFFADGSWAYTYLASVLHGGPGSVHGTRRPVAFPKPLHAEDVKLVHPDFERYLKWSWVNSTHQHKPVHRPTTGGIMLLLALHTCDTVNVYGFGGSYQRFSEHYYDKTYSKHVNYANHDNAVENKLWERLHDLGIINMYKRE